MHNNTSGHSKVDSDLALLIYLSGLFDGEGTCYLDKGRPKIAVGMTSDVVALFHSRFGGSYRPDKPANGLGKKPIRYWQIAGAKAQEALRQMLPYLKVQKMKARELLQVRVRSPSEAATERSALAIRNSKGQFTGRYR